MPVTGFDLEGVEVVKMPTALAPTVHVRYRGRNGRWTTALLVVECPFCGAPHRHKDGSTLGAVVTAKCDRQSSYRLSYAGVSA